MPRTDAPTDAKRQLAGATSPDERVRLTLRAAEEDSDGRLCLPAENGLIAEMEGLDLSSDALRARREQQPGPVPWWDDEREAPTLREADLRGANLRNADLRGVDLMMADLRGAVLAGSDLRGARLERARLDEADLADARLDGANLNGADLDDALLENVSMKQVQLRFATLERTVLEDSSLEGADAWGADFEDAFLNDANLRRARLHEADLRNANFSGAILREADLRQSDFRGARLNGADLREARVTGARFEDAWLQRALLQDVDFGGCQVERLHLAGARLSMTQISRVQLGGALGEELEENYEQASAGYIALENNFEMIGDSDAARWAYVRKRVMQKRGAGKEAVAALRAGDVETAAARGGEYARAAFTEWLCGYGESIPRTFSAILAVFVCFTLFYGFTGSVTRVAGEGAPEVLHFNSFQDALDVATFSLVTMTAAEGPDIGLEPVSYVVYLATGVQVLITIALTGLLGFVLGNRIRR